MASAPGGVGLLLKRCLAVSVAPFTTVEDDSYIASRVREVVGRNLRPAVDALLRDASGTLPRSTGRRVTIKTPAEMRADDDRAARVSSASVRSRRSWSSAASLARVWTRLSRARRATLDVSTRRLARTCEGAPRVSLIGPRLITRREHSWAEFPVSAPRASLSSGLPSSVVGSERCRDRTTKIHTHFSRARVARILPTHDPSRNVRLSTMNGQRSRNETTG